MVIVIGSDEYKERNCAKNTLLNQYRFIQNCLILEEKIRRLRNILTINDEVMLSRENCLIKTNFKSISLSCSCVVAKHLF
jgi:hypothetical protein